MPFTTPPGFKVYEKDMVGYTVRLAIDPVGRRMTPERSGFRLAKDQDAPVYDVLRRDGQGKITHGGDQWTQADQDARRAEIVKVIDEHKGNKVFEFAEAHKRLLLEGRVPEHVAEHRLTICTGKTAAGDVIGGACQNYSGENGVRGSGHCSGCGCPNWDVAAMNRPGNKVLPGKAWYPMGCPKGKFSDHPGRRA